jgi:hypothetical protein
MKEVLKQALEALKSMKGTLAEHDEPTTFNEDEAIKALEEALAKQSAECVEQSAKHVSVSVGEPVAFKIYKPTPPRHATPNVRDAELPWVYDQDPSSGNVASMWVTPVQATPPKQAEKQEPVAWMYDWTTSEGEFIQNWTTSEAESLRDTEPTIITNVRPLYTTPPQRKPLTDEQIKAIRVACGDPLAIHIEFARAIEAAHGIKE